MDNNVTRLSPGTRTFLQVASVLCIITAVVLVVLGMMGFLGAMRTVPDVNPRGTMNGAIDSFVLFLLSMPFLIAGSIMAKFGFLKPVSEIVATETTGAVGVSGHALGKGLASGFREAGFGAPSSGTTQVVKVRCRSCNFLESEDAKYCSQCRTAMV